MGRQALRGAVVTTAALVFAATACTSSEPASVTPGAETTTAPVAAPAAPAFSATVSPVGAADLPASWRPGCPVPPEQLRLVHLSHWGFDDRPASGGIVVHVAQAENVIAVFRQLYEQRFPIRRMEPVDAFGGDDRASMAADNTSGFNCRNAVASGPPRWSAHAYGDAIDLNPVENPYLQGGEIQPPEGTRFVDRAQYRPGMAMDGGVVTTAFASVGWSWGGRWAETPDYQHFSASGG